MSEEDENNDSTRVKKKKTTSSHEETLAYWTQQKMESAEPIELEIDPDENDAPPERIKREKEKGRDHGDSPR